MEISVGKGVIIIRQDRNGVRTPQDIERKYNFARLEKAMQLYEDSITRENNTLDNFIYATVGSLETFEGVIDGNITTYFHSGVPTMENYPVTEWAESEYEEHIDDIYYDKDTGFAYVFFLNEETSGYGWSRTHAGYIIQAMAVANSAKDTADRKRIVFTDTPYPPYENGDLWFREGEIYICQISKSESEVFEDDDFIIATKYTDNTIAKQVGDELKVLEGTVLKVVEDAEQFKVELDDLDNETASEMSLLKNQFELKFQTTTEAINDVDGELKSMFALFNKHFGFDINGLSISSGNSVITLELDNEKGVVFKRNGEAFGLWDGDNFYTGNIVLRLNERAQFGNFAFVPRSDGSLSFLKVGDS